MKRCVCLLVSVVAFGRVMAEAAAAQTPPAREGEATAEASEVKPAQPAEAQAVGKEADTPVVPKMCVPTKPATMESEAFRRAKRNHRGMPIDGCAPVPRHLMRERFGEPDHALPKKEA